MGLGNLKTARTERRAIAAGVIVLDLPRPMSVNNLFFNVPGRGRVPTKEYTAWRKLAAQEIMLQRPRCLVGPVEITITVLEGRADIDGQAKCCLDSLVENGIIDDDDHKTVRKLTLQWGHVLGARVEISPAPQIVQRRDAATGKRAAWPPPPTSSRQASSL